MAEPKGPSAAPLAVADDAPGEDGLDWQTQSIREAGPATPASPSPGIRQTAAASFASGDRVGGRYRIARLIARGGMGEVYAAQDTELGGWVALKTLRAGASHPHAQERLKREVALARRVTHPNVCRLYDLGFHLTESGERLPFLTMELLEGETLADRIARGRLSTEQALPLVRDLAAALDAAHAAGVLHRDFKSRNVLLVPDAAAPGGLRAVVTDFGLARAELAEGDSLSGGGLLGTPAYMAPEQVSGAPLTPAADLYALGVVLFEMLTGRKPFVGQGPLDTASRRLHSAPPTPSQWVPQLDPRWEQATLRLLEREPERRFASGAELLAALTGPHPSAAPRGTSLRQRVTALGVALAIAGLVAAAGWGLKRHRSAVTPAASLPPATAVRRSVAVLGLANLSGQAETAWLSTAFAELLGSALTGAQLRPVPGSEVAQAARDLKLGPQGDLGLAQLAPLRSLLGSDWVVAGSYLVSGSGADAAVRVDVRLLDAASGEVVAALNESETLAALPQLVSRLAGRLRAAAGLRDAPPAPSEGRSRALPADPGAARAYAEGLALQRRFDPQGALPLLEKAAAASDSPPAVHLALAHALEDLGLDARARAEAERALALAAGLGQEMRVAIEAGHREIRGEWDQAAGLYRALAGFFPEDLEYGLHLAECQTRAGRGKEALETLAGLRRLAAARSDPRLDLAEAAAAESLDDARREQAAALTAAGRAEALGAVHVGAWARRYLAWALLVQGKFAEAREAAEASRAAFAAQGNRFGEAQTLNILGAILHAQGDLAGSEAAFRASLATRREIGDRRGLSSTLNNLAKVRDGRAPVADVEALYRESIALARETGDRAGAATTLANLASIEERQGATASAIADCESALALFRELGNVGSEGWMLSSIGIGLRKLGRLGESEARIREALPLLERAGAKGDLVQAHAALGRTLLARGDLAGARAASEAELRLASALGDARRIAGARLGLAENDALAGRGAQAGAELAEAERALDEKARARVGPALELTRAEVHLAQRQPGPALAAAELAIGRLEHDDPRHQVEAQLVALRAALAGRDTDAAARHLDAARRAAVRHADFGPALELRLREAELGLLRGKVNASREAFERVAREAEQRGFGLLAVQARALLAAHR